MPKDALQEDYDEGVLEGSALVTDGMEDEPGVVDHRDRGPSLSHHSTLPREYLQRRSSRDSGHSRRSQRSDRSKRRGSDGQNQNPTPSLSRRPSDEHRVEEDVCYPMLEMREADMEGRGHRENSPSRDNSEHMHRRSFNNNYNMGMPGVLPNFPFPFDFNALEDFCEEDREKHGIAIPKSRRADQPAELATSAQSGARTITFSPDKSDGEGGMRKRMHGGISRRQRKLSESVGSGHVGRYQRKLAIFEGGSVGGQRLDDKADANVKTPLLTGESKTRPGFGATTNGTHRSINSAGEKARPYRFSFYSNALPSTIHARSLAEIPADGQTFEELFVGRSTSSPPPEEWEGSPANGAEVNQNDSMLPAQKPGSTGYNTPNGGPGATGPSLSSYKTGGGVLGNMHRSGTGTYQPKPRTQLMRSIEDAEANTWWLDVLCPTDAEMKVLGKVFGIHPLTIEDILMEETREKIELFRNYYLVCFRSFDQDPYSPTYLEALNMYIVVFREGTLSFHFRGTPHPQNVRRRIKQLKDFINVTSDWISYALIDDITDAFGPLIQNIEYEVDSIDELVLILKDAEQSDMLRRIGTCRKKVMGLLRLMGNKADVVKGLAKRCNENWSVAPKSDIGLYLSDIQVGPFIFG
jgi:magnesium transporter